MERATRQRDAVLAAITTAGRPLSTAEILRAARRRVPGLGIATVYRNVKRLVEEGTVEAITLPGDSARYELAETEHHHHFMCTQCTRVFDIPGCTGVTSLRAPRGFSVHHHDVTLYGRCADCGSQRVSR